MKIYELKRKQILNKPLAEVWDFFSTPRNLNAITPPGLDFRILSELPREMFAGQIISYSILILPFYRQTWVTEISHVSPRQFFVDEQRFGPYKFWHHRHDFEERDEGVLMTDHVHYALPFGSLGRLVAYLPQIQESNLALSEKQI